MSPGLEIPVIAAATAAACALPGCFIVLQRLGLLADAIGHTVLLGIVLAYLAGAPLGSPYLVVGATLAGMATAGLVQLLRRHRFIAPDAAIGLVFPTLFALAIVLVTRFAGDVHLDTDAVLLGMLELAPVERVVWGDQDLGPRALVIMSVLLLINVVVIGLLRKEFQLATFDPGQALAAGLSPVLIHWILMALVSVTAVGAFEVVGGVLVVALMVGPPATALLLVRRLGAVLWLAPLVGILGAVGGVLVARWLDANLAGTMAATQAALFLVVLVVAPRRGLLALAMHRGVIEREFHLEMLLVHLVSHAGTADETRECTEEHLTDHLGWDPKTARMAIELARDRNLIEVRTPGRLRPTPNGIQRALEGAVR